MALFLIKLWVVGVLAILLSEAVTAQVGVNTTQPQALLHIKETDSANPTTITGVLFPKVEILLDPEVVGDLPDGLVVYYIGPEINGLRHGLYFYYGPERVWIELRN